MRFGTAALLSIGLSVGASRVWAGEQPATATPSIAWAMQDTVSMLDFGIMKLQAKMDFAYKKLSAVTDYRLSTLVKTDKYPKDVSPEYVKYHQFPNLNAWDHQLIFNSPLVYFNYEQKRILVEVDSVYNPQTIEKPYANQFEACKAALTDFRTVALPELGFFKDFNSDKLSKAAVALLFSHAGYERQGAPSNFADNLVKQIYFRSRIEMETERGRVFTVCEIPLLGGEISEQPL